MASHQTSGSSHFRLATGSDNLDLVKGAFEFIHPFDFIVNGDVYLLEKCEIKTLSTGIVVTPYEIMKARYGVSKGTTYFYEPLGVSFTLPCQRHFKPLRKGAEIRSLRDLSFAMVVVTYPFYENIYINSIPLGPEFEPSFEYKIFVFQKLINTFICDIHTVKWTIKMIQEGMPFDSSLLTLVKHPITGVLNLFKQDVSFKIGDFSNNINEDTLEYNTFDKNLSMQMSYTPESSMSAMLSNTIIWNEFDDRTHQQDLLPFCEEEIWPRMFLTRFCVQNWQFCLDHLMKFVKSTLEQKHITYVQKCIELVHKNLLAEKADASNSHLTPLQKENNKRMRFTTTKLRIQHLVSTNEIEELEPVSHFTVH